MVISTRIDLGIKEGKKCERSADRTLADAQRMIKSLVCASDGFTDKLDLAKPHPDTFELALSTGDIDHIDHIAKLVGVDHVGLGSDYDGVPSLPKQLEDVSAYPVITQGSIDRGYSDADIRKVLAEKPDASLPQDGANRSGAAQAN